MSHRRIGGDAEKRTPSVIAALLKNSPEDIFEKAFYARHASPIVEVRQMTLKAVRVIYFVGILTGLGLGSIITSKIFERL